VNQLCTRTPSRGWWWVRTARGRALRDIRTQTGRKKKKAPGKNAGQKEALKIVYSKKRRKSHKRRGRHFFQRKEGSATIPVNGTASHFRYDKRHLNRAIVQRKKTTPPKGKTGTGEVGPTSKKGKKRTDKKRPSGWTLEKTPVYYGKNKRSTVKKKQQVSADRAKNQARSKRTVKYRVVTSMTQSIRGFFQTRPCWGWLKARHFASLREKRGRGKGKNTREISVPHIGKSNAETHRIQRRARKIPAGTLRKTLTRGAGGDEPLRVECDNQRLTRGLKKKKCCRFAGESKRS